MANYEVGMLVRHPARQEWGLGKVLTVEGAAVKIHFKNDKDRDYRAILTTRIELEVPAEQSDPVLDNLPPFNGDGFATAAKRVTFEDGLERFMQIFPAGFEDAEYLERERNYKWRAHERFEAELSRRGGALLGDGDGRGLQWAIHTPRYQHWPSPIIRSRSASARSPRRRSRTRRTHASARPGKPRKTQRSRMRRGTATHPADAGGWIGKYCHDCYPAYCCRDH